MARLDEWVGTEVAVRVVSDSDDLIAVFQGRLAGRWTAKQPALFWPLDGKHIEQPGIYLHPERLEGASVHEGGFVLEVRQAGMTLNIRRL